MHEDLLREFVAACKPEEPVSPEDHRHFDFDAPELRLRGAPWRERLAQVIRLASEPTAQLVTGLRGSGKTTELRQLQRKLEDSGRRVVLADAGQWLSDDRPLETEDLMLALVLALYPAGRPDDAAEWVREYATKAWTFLASQVQLSGDVEGMRVQLTTDETVFERVAKKLRGADGLRREIHSLLADAAEASRRDGEELVILLDGAEKRAVGDLHESERSAFHNHWFGSFILRGRDLRPPVHVVYTVPSFMIRRGAELAANFGSELHFLPMVRVYDRESKLDLVGVEALTRALFKRVPAEHFADEVTPRWLAAQSGGYFRDLLRFVTEMVYQVGHAPQFTRVHAEAAVSRIQQTYLEALVREDKAVLAEVHPSKSFPDQEAAQLRMDSLLQGFKMFRYHNGSAWYDAHPLCWAELGFAADLPSWEHLEEVRG